MRERYAAQVGLLVRLIPFVAEEVDFALKGGTAINLFHRNLPRYSVDIDLVHLPVGERGTSLEAIADGLRRIAERIDQALPDVHAVLSAGGGNQETRILVQASRANIKIEVSPVLRGTLFPPRKMRVHEAVEEKFGFAEMPLIAYEELFAGKIVAALDRAHPRDLFDVRELLATTGLSDDLFRVFLVYLICSGRPMHELLDPGPIDAATAFRRDFEGMTVEPVSLEALHQAHVRLLRELRLRLSGNAAAFLEGVHDCRPEFGLIGLPQAAELPAVRWKLRNLERFRKESPERHADQLDALRALFVESS
jgi:hypothetical protein